MATVVIQGYNSVCLITQGYGPTGPAPASTTIRRALVAALLGDSAVSALAGTKVLPVHLAESQTTPSVLYKLLSDRPEHTLDGHNGVNRANVIFICQSKNLSSCETLGRAVFDLFDGYVGTLPGSTLEVIEVLTQDESDTYDPAADMSDRGMFTTPVEFLFRYRKPKPSR